MGRLIEIKNEIVNHDLKNYQSYAELFVDIKMIPNDFTIPVPDKSSTILNSPKFLNNRSSLNPSRGTWLRSIPNFFLSLIF